MKAVVLDKTGKPDVLKVTDVDKPTIDENQVLVKVKYSGINYADLLSRQGLYSWSPKRPYIMGLEAVGEIVEIGSTVTDKSIGDRVLVGKQHGGYAEYIVTDSIYALPIPDEYSFEEAVSFGVVWFTAWVGLYEMARVRKGETLLVHAAAGGVGIGAVKLGLALGMKVYGTASTEEKRNVIREMGAIPLKYEDFDQELNNIGDQPDCIIETIGGDVYKRGFDILAPMGRIVLIGASGIQVNKWNPLSLYRAWKALPRARMSQVLRRSRAFMGLHIGYMMNDPDRLLPSWQKMLSIMIENKLKPVFREEQVYPLSRVSEAHQFMHDRKNIGKILLEPSK
jgi:NADPH2:quinone reductase